MIDKLIRKYPKYRPLIICDEKDVAKARKLNVDAISWLNFLFSGPLRTKN